MKKDKKRKIVCVTGCRSEYDILYPVLRELEKDGSFDVSVIVSGAHLSERFGYTVQEIKKDGFRIAGTIHSLLDSDREIGKVKSSSVLMLGLSDSLYSLMPDFVMVVGDREEAIISAVVCTYLGIPFVHLCGGDRTHPKAGDVDEPIRHAVSKLASLHCTMNSAHRARLIKMGEEPWRICNSGNPALDRFKEIKVMPKHEVLKYFGFSAQDIRKPLVFVLQHAISGEAEHGGRHMKSLLEAVTHLNANCIINYPNSDMGSRGIIRVINHYGKLPNVRVTKNIPRKEFVNMLRSIELLIGNSSMAFLEGGFLKIPAINVGERNKERMNAGNVVFVAADTMKIKTLAKKIITDSSFSRTLKASRSLYGDGNSSSAIVKFLKNLRRTKEELLAKDITY